jgi:Putative auto-transporter adhesin, head GIN domain
MKRIITAFLILAVFTASAQKSEKRIIESFDKLDVYGNIEVEMILSDTESIDIFTTNIDPSEIDTEIKDKLLKIKMKSNLFDDDAKVKVVLRYKEIREISSNAAADVNVKNIIKGDKLFVTATSGGRIKLHVELNAIDLKSYQGAHIDISGKTVLQESFVNTGGVLSGQDFSSDEVFIKMNTGGKAEIIVIKSIEANVNTGASLNYFGTPEKENIKTTLGGKINAWDKKE